MMRWVRDGLSFVGCATFVWMVWQAAFLVQ
jgi:hypothetical protein